MDFSFRFDRWFDGLPHSPKDVGRVERLVLRPRGGGHGGRETPDSVRMTPEEGVVGDAWVDDKKGSPDNQISFINTHVISSLTGGDSEKMVMSGDNVQVDLELSEENLPTGTRVRLGAALLEVSSAVHRPCGLFAERFGATGAKKVARALRRGLRGRGLLLRVVEAGEVKVGDEIRVERG
jgi:MOSC domain-containing protein YiiM